MSDRYFSNPFLKENCSDSSRSLSYEDGKLESSVNISVNQTAAKLFHKFEDSLKHLDAFDTSVYTGNPGIALLYMLLDRNRPEFLGQRKGLLETALKLAEPAIKHAKRKRVSFLCGDPGPLSICAVLYNKLGHAQKSKECIQRVVAMAKVALDPSGYDELLYGRAGYLYALYFIQKHIGDTAVEQSLIDEVIEAMVESGKALGRKQKPPIPLMYMWHDSYYLGAAHGVAGIFFLLMRSPGFTGNSDLQKLVKDSVDYLITLRFPSGNYPSSFRSRESDKLIHWCHGAPGFIHMFLQAFELFKEEIYLKEAVGCADVIWERGLLRKGYGICHGVAGNAYAFLAIWKVTKDEKYLHRAIKFAEWIGDYGKHGCRQADSPLSLFEGMAGTIYFLVDLLQPEKAEFPAFH